MASELTRRLRAQWSGPGRIETLLVLAAFPVPLTLLFAVVLVKSMSWETIVDTPMFMYTGDLMDRLGMAPMRDFFTYNMPGTHVIFRWLYHFFGGTVLGMRLADTAVLAVVLALLARTLRPFGVRVAWTGAVTFGLLHLTIGQHCYLQRDFLALVPLQLAFLSATQWFESKPRLRWGAAGFFVGVLATIKPHLMIGGIVLYGYLVSQSFDTSGRGRAARATQVAGWCALGGCIPVLWMAAYLAFYGQLGAFVRVVVEYFPLHANISGSHRVFTAGEKGPYVLQHLFGAGAWDKHHALALGAGVGLTLFFALPGLSPAQRRYGGVLSVWTLVYLLYPCIATRFYEHHYYPFRLMVSGWAAFCLFPAGAGAPRRLRAFALIAATYAFAGTFYVNYDTLTQPPSVRGFYARTTRIHQWLATRLQPNDTVQGIEWAFCGINHAFLEVEARPATRTVWGEVLYHHVSTPLVKELRRDFIDEIQRARPRFVVYSLDKSDFVQGTDTTMAFPELDRFLKENYFVALDVKDFRIWEINTSPTAADDRAKAIRPASGAPLMEERHP